MLALVDADVLRYEVGSIGENNGPDMPEPMNFDRVAEYLDQRIEQMRVATDSDAVQLYLTGKKNFRNNIAVTKEYKGNRKNEKPFHFQNLTAYMLNAYDCVYAEGMEADDLMAVRQLRDTDLCDTVICTRDKDLRMIPGYHYGWECGAQPELHKHFVTYDGKLWQNGKKVEGNGMAFFYLQLLVGDGVDNIPGCPGVGPVRAWNLLKDAEPHEMFHIVRGEYKRQGKSDEYLLEQGRLLWMTRELTDEGEPVLWQFPD